MSYWYSCLLMVNHKGSMWNQTTFHLKDIWTVVTRAWETNSWMSLHIYVITHPVEILWRQLQYRMNPSWPIGWRRIPAKGQKSSPFSPTSYNYLVKCMVQVKRRFLHSNNKYPRAMVFSPGNRDTTDLSWKARSSPVFWMLEKQKSSCRWIFT